MADVGSAAAAAAACCGDVTEALPSCRPLSSSFLSAFILLEADQGVCLQKARAFFSCGAFWLSMNREKVKKQDGGRELQVQRG